jgi:hypothetical protein
MLRCWYTSTHIQTDIYLSFIACTNTQLYNKQLEEFHTLAYRLTYLALYIHTSMINSPCDGIWQVFTPLQARTNPPTVSVSRTITFHFDPNNDWFSRPIGYVTNSYCAILSVDTRSWQICFNVFSSAGSMFLPGVLARYASENRVGSLTTATRFLRVCLSNSDPNA